MIRTAMADGPRVFISYRREDCMVHAGRLAENLQARAAARVFLDIESIPPGVSFPDFIEREIATCDVVLVMIGDDWLTATNDTGHQRLADPLDWVHLEIVAALERGVLTIPVLVEGTRMPRPADLPSPVANLALRNAVELRDRSWPHDVDWLIRALPAPTFERPAAESPAPENWPARFTDSWFAANVPGMDEARLRALRAELYKRSWNDNEIASRALIHAQPTRVSEGPPATPPAASHAGFPRRFTDSWFAQNVPHMDATRISELTALLHSRTWNDTEIAARVLVHARSGIPTEASTPLRSAARPTAMTPSGEPPLRRLLTLPSWPSIRP
jgi:hypothetical protein